MKGEVMNKRKRSRNITAAKYLDVDGLQQLLSLGRNSCLAIGKESGALRKIGKRSLYCVETVVDYIEKQESLEIS